jgi:two-component system nitrate/nitrite response regulator NarL
MHFGRFPDEVSDLLGGVGGSCAGTDRPELFAPPPAVACAIAVLIAGGVRVYREGLAQVLGQRAGIQVVGVAGTPEELVARARQARPDVVLLDMAMPGITAVVRELGGTATVAFSVSDSEAGLVACIQAGVCGFVPRDGSLADLLAAIENTARGEVTCPPRIAAHLFHEIAGSRSQAGPSWRACSLTPREWQIATLIDRGCSNKEIAKALRIANSTVKNHVHNILEKCQVHRRSDVATIVSPR